MQYTLALVPITASIYESSWLRQKNLYLVTDSKHYLLTTASLSLCFFLSNWKGLKTQSVHFSACKDKKGDIGMASNLYVLVSIIEYKIKLLFM